ncbi:MAG: PLP-dependent aminotransferase family protein [Lachnospiraceae bacterium]|nr:PLP-dependent aminotransferase family protein [Lachnospiraceae bacterium]
MHDMTIQLNADTDKCLYEQIYEYIRQEIREGKLLAGERLPSTRSLAEYLQVARSTIEYAYDQLSGEGYIEARACRGYFVCPLDEILWLEESHADGSADGMEGDIGHDVHEASDYMHSRFKLDFSPGGTDMSVFPFSVWKRITKNTLNEGNTELFSQGEPQGDYSLRMTISRYLHSSRGVECTPEQLVVGAGNDYLMMLLEKLLGPHVNIAMENPTYKRAYKIFSSFDYNIITVGMDRSGMKVQELAQTEASCAYVMPSHQFPMGTVMPIGRRTEILRWANESPDRYIIEDDYDSEFRYRGKPIPSLQSSDKNGRVIYMGTFSKAIAPAIRVGYMVLPEPLLKKYRSECGFYSCTVSRIDQRILEEFIGNGYFERHLNKMRKLYKEKHDIMLKCLEPFEKSFIVSGEDAGLHLLLTARGNITEKELIDRAEKEEVKVYGLSDSFVDIPSNTEIGHYGFASRGATVILGFGGLDRDNITEGMKRLEKAWL